MASRPHARARYAVVRRVFEEGAYADRALHGEAARLQLSPRDRALATRLAYGVVQRRDDARPRDRGAGRPAGPQARAGRARGAAARACSSSRSWTACPRTPPSASRSSSPSATRARGAGLVNAVLRRAAREARALVDALPDGTAAEAALRHSHPRWIAELWFDALGAGRRPAR